MGLVSNCFEIYTVFFLKKKKKKAKTCIFGFQNLPITLGDRKTYQFVGNSFLFF